MGLAGGESGAAGENIIDGETVAAKTTREVTAGTTITVRTPGGGGYGDPSERNRRDIERDRREEKIRERTEPVGNGGGTPVADSDEET